MTGKVKEFNLIGKRVSFSRYHAYKHSSDGTEGVLACGKAYPIGDLRTDDGHRHVTCEECRRALGYLTLDNVSDYGFNVRLNKPIDAFTDEELDDLSSDHDMLERDTESLGKLIEDEYKRRPDRSEG